MIGSQEIKLEPLQRIFSDEELAGIDCERVPRHIAVIPDGNRRWAATQKRALQEGHFFGGTEVLMEAVQAAAELGVRAFTFYAFSTENWHREEEEVDFLLQLLKRNLIEYAAKMLQHGVRLHTIGDLSAFGPELQQLFDQVKRLTCGCTTIDLILAVNYGARSELCRAVRKIGHECAQGKLSPDAIDEPLLSRYLDTAPWQDPDLFIRTSGEKRLSNFLLWQLCYTELYVSDVLWPDFRARHLLKAVKEFQKRKRRFGA